MLRWRVVLIVVFVGCSSGASSERSSLSETTSPANQSLFDRLGGIEALRTLTDELVLALTADERLSARYVDTDIGALKLSLIEHLCVTAAGPCEAEARDLERSHRRFSRADFDAWLVHFDGAIERAKIEALAGAELAARLREQADAITATGE